MAAIDLVFIMIFSLSGSVGGLLADGPLPIYPDPRTTLIPVLETALAGMSLSALIALSGFWVATRCSNWLVYFLLLLGGAVEGLTIAAVLLLSQTIDGLQGATLIGVIGTSIALALSWPWYHYGSTGDAETRKDTRRALARFGAALGLAFLFVLMLRLSIVRWKEWDPPPRDLERKTESTVEPSQWINIMNVYNE